MPLGRWHYYTFTNGPGSDAVLPEEPEEPEEPDESDEPDEPEESSDPGSSVEVVLPLPLPLSSEGSGEPLGSDV